MEDEHHFLFDCPAYSSIRGSHANLSQCACSVSEIFDSCKANACGGVIRNCFSLRRKLDSMNSHKQSFVWWPSVGPRDIEHKQTHKQASACVFFGPSYKCVGTEPCRLQMHCKITAKYSKALTQSRTMIQASRLITSFTGEAYHSTTCSLRCVEYSF